MPIAKTKLPEQADTEAESQGKFEIIYADALLTDAKAGDAPDKIARGAIAKLSMRFDGRTVCRAEFRDDDRSVVYAYSDWSMDPLLRKPPDLEPERPARRFAKDVASLEQRGFKSFTLKDYGAIAREFSATWKELYPDFTVLDAHPAPIFPVGTVRWPASAPHPFDIFDTNWVRARVVLDHSVGNFGLHGKFDDNPHPLSEEEAFCVGMLERPRANSAAILRGAGSIESLYLLRDWEQEKFRKGRPHTTDLAALRVVTLLNPGGNQTLAHVISYNP